MYLSVIICTHNPREDYLRRTLQGLRVQSLPVDRWELLLIDNASTNAITEYWDVSWHPLARVIREERLGLTQARLRGIAEAKGRLLVFVDDDNVLEERYLEHVVAIANRLPSLGCFGAGRIIAEYEITPSDELLPFTGMLALRAVEEDSWTNRPNDDCVPWGAGLVVLTEVAQQHRKALSMRNQSLLLGRAGSALNSAEDNDFSWTACGMGLGKGIFTSLQLTHLIAKERLEESYLCRIAEGHAFSWMLLDAIHGREVSMPCDPPSIQSVLNALRKMGLSSLLVELQRWNTQRNQRRLQKKMDQAMYEGRKRAFNLIQSAGLASKQDSSEVDLR